MQKKISALMSKMINNPFVYHYTSVESLFAILEGYRLNKGTGAIPFRATNIYKTNDPREMTLGFEAVKSVLPQIEEDAKCNIELSNIYKDKALENKCVENMGQKPTSDKIIGGTIPYTISFSCKEDFLPMWSMYGNGGKGVCLKIGLYKLMNKQKSQPETPQFGFVSYSEEDYESLLKENLAELYDYSSIHKKIMSINDKIEELSLLCICLSPFVKSRDWSYEEEFRVVLNKHYQMEMDDNVICGLKMKEIEPYVFFQMKPNALKEIIIGPKANYDVLENIVRNELKECSLNDVVITRSNIEIL